MNILDLCFDKVRAGTLIVLTGAASLGLAACGGGGAHGGGTGGNGGNGGGGGALVAEYNDSEGPAAVDDKGNEIVRIVSIDRSTLPKDGTVRYVLENVSGVKQDKLTFAIQFYLPKKSGPGSQIPFDLEVTFEQPLKLYPDKPRVQVEAKCSIWTGGPFLGTKIKVEEERPHVTVPRGAEGPGSGTMFMSGLLECESLDKLFDLPIGCQITFENRSSQNLSNLVTQAVFLDSDHTTIIGETAWQTMPAMSPGGKAKVDFDLSSVARTSHDVWIRVKQGDVF